MVALIAFEAPEAVTDGYGYGDGDGDGDGDGYGYGYGYGDGDGSGYGDGYGYGYGYGDGDGYGSQDPAASDAYCAALAASVAGPSSGLRALWWSDARGLPSNGGNGVEAAAPGVVHRSAGPLNLCHAGTLHATWRWQKWKGERLWVVNMRGEVAIQEDKIGALEREIVAEIPLGVACGSGGAA